MNRKQGQFLIALGSVLIIYAILLMDVALPNSDVVNIHLMNNKQNALILGGYILIAGIIVTSVSKPQQVKCQYCAESISREARICKHCGKEVIPSPASSNASFSEHGLREAISTSVGSSIKIFTVRNILKVFAYAIIGLILTMLLENQILVLAHVTLSDGRTFDQWRSIANIIEMLIFFSVIVIGATSNNTSFAASRVLTICFLVSLATIFIKIFSEKLNPPGIYDLAISVILATAVYVANRNGKKIRAAQL